MMRSLVARRTSLLLAVPTTLLALTLGACGSESDGDDDTRAEDTTQTTPSTGPGSTSPSPSTGGGGVDFDEVAILHATAAGGETSAAPVVLDSDAAVADFVAPFTRGDLGQQVQTTYDATKVPDGRTMVGSVISIGCDVPPGVTVSAADSLTITPKKVASPLPECLAPVTTVALVLVDSDAVT
ncbi:hypothetical protein [Nocardioides sp. Root151]|uniref:hypothetical protein n=1 Tax=Nocardioides sp. Root151 TaxID=1736475 RepID=UPI000712FF22|nr:hypothetical protein [Nocardioides sp. Root151]KQZ67169.1 hypothetical protein ASD66_19475 [Nocardioides sp. Root151]